MLFNELRFLIFFVVVFAVHWLMPWNRARKIWLLIVSNVFYGCWDWRFLSLLWISTMLDYTVGRGLSRPGCRRRAWLAASLVGNLGLLGFFKYFNFFIDSAVSFLAFLGLEASRPTLVVLLPAGISFYTFQTLSYAIDVYWGKLQARRSLLDFGLFVCFFPQLVAGPILRAADFLPQLDQPRRWRDVQVRAALVLFLAGFIKKACISDGLAPAIENYFAAPQDFAALSAWIAMFSFAVQVYCDFSGYSDMATACGALLGYRFMLNFDRPYLAGDVIEFWRRWHISLSSWLRDYLYVPLGGNRDGRWRTYRNLFFTMLLSGLWHGAGWNFVIWGGLHGVALGIQRLRLERGSPRLPRWLGVPATFFFVSLCLVLFRAPALSNAAEMLRALVTFHGAGEAQLDPRLLLVLALLAGAHVLGASARLSGWWRRGPDWLFAANYALMTAAVLPFVSVDFVPFIYFQF